MSEDVQPGTNGGGMLRNVIIGIIGVYVIFSLYFMYQQNTRINAIEAKMQESNEDLGKKIAATQSQVKSAHSELQQKVGETQAAFQARAAQLAREQKAAEGRLTEEQKKQQEALGAVAGDVSSVKTEVGGVKTDVTATKQDLEATKSKLERTIGDLGIQSGLIATTREDLEFLKHKGDRNYFEFTLAKGKSATPISTISLQLKKADKKKGKYTLNVLADDKTIEKKDKNMNEPVQFYTGRDRMLYELVVFNVDKDKVSGYVSTPKNAPMAVNR